VKVSATAVIVLAPAICVWTYCINAVAVKVWAPNVGLRRASIVWVELRGVPVFVGESVGLKNGVADGNVGVSVIVAVLVVVGLLVRVLVFVRVLVTV
jgi:hypothetical protein